MIDGRKVLALIPARGGSKGLPGKNIRPLCGKPMIAWTIEKARKSRFLDEIMVSTDSAEIAEIARTYGASVPFLRPAELASDTASTLDVVIHALDHLGKEGKTFDWLVMLEPTSPLREDDDIDHMLQSLLARQDEWDAIVSVGEVHEHPSIVKRIENGRVMPFCPSVPLTFRRQDNEKAFFPYGVAYISKIPSLLSQRTFYPERCGSYQIKRYQCYEVDDLHDFTCIESIMRLEWGLP